MSFLNSHDRLGYATTIYWNEFPEKEEMEFE